METNNSLKAPPLDVPEKKPSAKILWPVLLLALLALSALIFVKSLQKNNKTNKIPEKHLANQRQQPLKWEDMSEAEKENYNKKMDALRQPIVILPNEYESSAIAFENLPESLKNLADKNSGNTVTSKLLYKDNSQGYKIEFSIGGALFDVYNSYITKKTDWKIVRAGRSMFYAYQERVNDASSMKINFAAGENNQTQIIIQTKE